MACETCFHSQIPSCADEIIVNAGLTPSTLYYYVITDKFGNKYTNDVTTTLGGLMIIDTSELPEGLITPYSGDFTLEIYDMDDNLMEYSIGAVDYSCITLSAFKAEGSFTAYVPSVSDVLHIDTDEAIDMSIDDSYTGAIDGVNQDYTTAQDYQPGTLMIYYNGNRLRITTDYTETGSNTFHLTFVPQVGDSLIVDYIVL